MQEIAPTTSVLIGIEEHPYDPERGVAVIPCEHCGRYNGVEVELDDGEAMFVGFVCDTCGHWNAA